MFSNLNTHVVFFFIRRIRVCVSDNENTRLLLAFLRVVEADRYAYVSLSLFVLTIFGVLSIGVYVDRISCPRFRYLFLLDLLKLTFI